MSMIVDEYSMISDNAKGFEGKGDTDHVKHDRMAVDLTNRQTLEKNSSQLGKTRLSMEQSTLLFFEWNQSFLLFRQGR
jgi:hypothetical protein